MINKSVIMWMWMWAHFLFLRHNVRLQEVLNEDGKDTELHTDLHLTLLNYRLTHSLFLTCILSKVYIRMQMSNRTGLHVNFDKDMPLLTPNKVSQKRKCKKNASSNLVSTFYPCLVLTRHTSLASFMEAPDLMSRSAEWCPLGTLAQRCKGVSRSFPALIETSDP